MFTGIIEEVGRIESVEEGEGIRTISIAVPTFDDLKAGASVAVDGACLTVARVVPGGFGVDVIDTTLSRTIAGRYHPGARVNLERAMALGGRLDGHLVQGHVDGIGELVAVDEEEGRFRMEFRIPPEVIRQTISHGSIALNGVSLTVNALREPDRCEVAIIPFTLSHTNLGDLEVGSPVNVEGDLIGKYVGKLVAKEERGVGARSRPGPNRPEEVANGDQEHGGLR
jgi:riboflavin synthase